MSSAQIVEQERCRKGVGGERKQMLIRRLEVLSKSAKEGKRGKLKNQ